MDFDIALQPKELELLALMERDDCSLIGYGGAKGGAKSHAARSAAIIRRLKYPGTRALIFRRNYDDLWQQHIQMIAEEWPGLFQNYWSAENKALMLPGRSMVLFRYADTYKDVMTFRGKEYGDVFIDEAAELEELWIKILYSSCRTTVRGFNPKKVLTFNPGGVGHGYVKRVFVDKQLEPGEAIQKPQFIQAYAWDNVMWVLPALETDGIPVSTYRAWPVERQIEYLISRSDYGKELNALPDALRKPWLYGDWDTFAGQVFAEFMRSTHVCKPIEIPAYWRRWRANDPGFSDPACWGWYAASETGRVYKYRERTYRRMPYSEQAKAVMACETPEERGRIEFTVTGMDAFVRDAETGKGPVDYYREQGLGVIIEPDHGAGCRARGAGVLHEYLRPMPKPDGEPGQIAKLAIFETCSNLIRTLPTLVMDEHDPEAVQESDSDHWYDETRYGLQAWHALRSQLPDQPVFQPGTAGDILKHAEKLNAGGKRKGPFT